MKSTVLKVHENDNVIIALVPLQKGQLVNINGESYRLQEDIPPKHKFVTEDLNPGDNIYMYGVLVGKAKLPIARSSLLSIANVIHAADELRETHVNQDTWKGPDVLKWRDRNFMGFHRNDGSVGTANYWLIVPMVFCENRNLDLLNNILLERLGYGEPNPYSGYFDNIISLYQNGKEVEDILAAEFPSTTADNKNVRLFENIDGIRFLNHTGGCGGTRDDAQSLCGLLAGYITHPNVAGATVLSLGCQHSQVSMLMDEIKKRSSGFNKPMYVVEQQQVGRGDRFIKESIKLTFAGLILANKNKREPAPLSKLCIGLECGGSDGFSGISANPAVGHFSDLLVGLQGSVILSEFPELCGVEKEIMGRCVNDDIAEKFRKLMMNYQAAAIKVGSGFDMNPSPGNIKDGLITDAIKSAGAAKKGGTSKITDVLDFPEQVTKSGLNLLCTPGNDVESTTAEVGAGANIVLFTTGLGTPTGNPIAPVIKIASNTSLFLKMPDILDINTGTIIDGTETIEQAGERILDFVIEVASGRVSVAAVRNNQQDFIFWKRGVSL